MFERQPLPGERAQLDQQLQVVEFAQQEVEARAARGVDPVAPVGARGRRQLLVVDAAGGLAGQPVLGRRPDPPVREAPGQRPAVASAQHRRADQRAQRGACPGRVTGSRDPALVPSIS